MLEQRNVHVGSLHEDLGKKQVELLGGIGSGQGGQVSLWSPDLVLNLYCLDLSLKS